jgi:hypothetical protein
MMPKRLTLRIMCLKKTSLQVGGRSSPELPMYQGFPDVRWTPLLTLELADGTPAQPGGVCDFCWLIAPP